MALTAALGLDVKLFEQGVKEAIGYAAAFEKEMKALDADLGKFGDDFSGEEIASEVAAMASAFEEVGSAATALEEVGSAALEEVGSAAAVIEEDWESLAASVDEAAASYGQLGTEAPAQVEKVAKATKEAEHWTDGFAQGVKSLVAGFTIANVVEDAGRALISFAQEAISGAGALIDLSNQTGASIGQIQEFAFVAQQTGVSVEAFAKASYNLGINIEEGSEKAVDAIERLGLSFGAIAAMTPEERFNAVAVALGEMENATERNRAGAELMGGSFRQIAPAMADGYRQIADEALKASDAQIQAIDRATDAWDAFSTNLVTRLRVMAGETALASERLERMGLLERTFAPFLKTFRELAQEQSEYLEGVEGATARVAEFGNTEKNLEAIQAQRKGTLAALAKESLTLRLTHEEQERIEKKLTESGKELISVNKQAAQEAKTLTDQKRRLQEAFLASVTYFNEADTGLGNYVQTVKSAATEIQKIVIAQQNLRAGLTETGLVVSRSIEETGKLTAANLKLYEAAGGVLAPAMYAYSGALNETTTKTKSFWDTVTGAFTGDKGVTGLLSFGQGVTNQFGGTWGKVFEAGSAVARAFVGDWSGVVQLAGQYMGKLVGWIGEGVGKIGGFFKKMFGGPSAEELAGRELVAAFEKNIWSMLSESQKMEAGNEDWKKTVIGLRDAYIDAGLSEEDALKAAEKLWASSREGAETSKVAIAEIEAVLKTVGPAAEASASDIDSITAAIDRIPREVEVNVRGNLDMPELPGAASYQHGSGGLKDFGKGTLALLHGRERVQTEAQMRAERRRVGSLGGVATLGAARPTTVVINAQGAFLGDLQSQLRFRKMLSDTLMTEADLRTTLAPAGAY